MGGEALALVSSSIDNGTLVTLFALRVSERTNENRLSFFFSFFPHLRHQVPGPIHEILEVSYSGASFIRGQE